MTAGNVHVGNVVEFHQHFLPTELTTDVQRDVMAGDLQYASIAPFYSPDPGLVLLPETDGDRWWAHQAELLQWNHFRPVPVSGALGPSFAELDGHQGYRDQIDAALAEGGSLIPWGESPEYRRFAADLPAESAVRSSGASQPAYAESKVNSAEIFAKVHAELGSPAGIHLAGERLCETEAELRAALAGAGARGETAVLKAPFGVGGYGTAVLEPSQTATAALVADLLAGLRERDGFHRGLPAIVQEYQWRSAKPWSDVSGDCTVDAAGRVQLEGVTAMTVNGTQFAGGVTDDGVVLPPRRAELLVAFCLGVGDVLARAGYRGWFDVDFVVRVADDLVPLEINARRTGTTAPLSVRTCVERLRGRPVTVISQDVVALPRRWASRPAFDRFLAATETCGLTRDVVPTLIAGTDAVAPYLGVAVVAADGAEAVRRLAEVKDALVTAFRD